MKKTTLKQRFATLSDLEVKQAITLWLEAADPPIYSERVDSVDETGATILLWSTEQAAEEPPLDGPEFGAAEESYDLPAEQRLAMLKARLRTFARTARLDTLRASLLQRQLIEIANEEDITDDDKD
jgi:hypothetical protein